MPPAFKSLNDNCHCTDAGRVLLSLDECGVHDVTGVLKQYLRQLPDPVIPGNMYRQFITAGRKYWFNLELPNHLFVGMCWSTASLVLSQNSPSRNGTRVRVSEQDDVTAELRHSFFANYSDNILGHRNSQGGRKCVCV